MSDYSKDQIELRKWNELIRLRPGMYVGYINIKGFVNLLKGIISGVLKQTASDQITFNFDQVRNGKIIFRNLIKPIADNWSNWNPDPSNPFVLELQTLNALSERFVITFWGEQMTKLGTESYEKGNLQGQKLVNKSLDCIMVEIDFLLDLEVWKDSFDWIAHYIIDEMNEFAYLNRGVKFELNYKLEGENCRIIKRYKNGLRDCLEIELLKGVGGSYLETELLDRIGEYEFEIAFAYRDYSVDQSKIASYVNDYYTPEEGSHVEGLLEGLTYGVMKYFQHHDLTEEYKISEKGIRANLVALLHIRMKTPRFSGCVKNKLANPELIPILSNYVSEKFYSILESDNESRQKLIEKFKV